MKIKNILLASICMWLVNANAQSVTGQFTQHTNTNLSLIGYKNTEILPLGNVNTDVNGKFNIPYNNYKGMASLVLNNEASVMIVLDNSDLSMAGTHLKELDSLQISNSPENTIFEKYTMAHSQRENALAGWLYLLRRYTDEKSILTSRTEVLNQIQNEIDALSAIDNKTLSEIDKNLYVSWYLPLRKLLADMPASVDHYWERIPRHIETFRNIDFNDERFIKSGLRDVLIEKHYWMLESSVGGIDTIVQRMNASTDYILANVSGNDVLYNEMSTYLLKMLEKRSLFASAEHLSLKLLTKGACTLDDKLANRAENYRAMKKGNSTKDIAFKKGAYRNGTLVQEVTSLSDIKNKQTLVVFGASWCPKCQEELMLIKKYYATWQQKGIEVLFVSIDEDPTTFSAFSSIFPWISTCDFKGWEGQAVKDYYVFGTPSLFLLDENRKIVERMYSVEQMNTLVKFMGK